MVYGSTLTRNKISTQKIKIFDPLSNIYWLEETVNLWLSENDVEVINMNTTYSDGKFIITLLYLER
ncbi:MAG: hypothetical protein A2086_17060 [Spirochaetes bacterium GWD1_27_9]|nr:MAG: hypothetical protein A2Z98_15385 [Spirochaetes bacterium GWB1_27_13]OHD27371.1 MAG: hypothetical protein A2Y34_07610 [Spirochaetes bacterium GWC1_27_15]OHD33339.1 MAG: hypothetical protein A2086_17060 [Spirochaetes bacterium GWD1_27_9]